MFERADVDAENFKPPRGTIGKKNDDHDDTMFRSELSCGSYASIATKTQEAPLLVSLHRPPRRTTNQFLVFHDISRHICSISQRHPWTKD